MKKKMPTDTCAFLPCDQVDECCLVGGCVKKRFGPQNKRYSNANADPMRKGQQALVGTKPGRAGKGATKPNDLLTTTQKKR